MNRIIRHIYRLVSFIGFIVVLLVPATIFSQQDDLYTKSEELIYSNPDEAIKIAEHVLKSVDLPQEIAATNLLLARIYLVKGDYNQAVTYAFNSNNHLTDVSTSTRVEINTLKSKLLRKLYLNKLSKDYLLKAKALVDVLPNKEDRNRLLSQIALEEINSQLDKRNYDEALLTINEAEIKFSSFLELNKSNKSDFYIAKIQALNNLSRFDSARVYMDRALDLMNSPQENNLYKKTVIFRDIGHLHLQQKEFKQSEEALFIALRFAEIIDNPILLKEIHSDLVINYIASNQKSQHRVYNDELLILNNEVESIEQESINTLYGMLSNQEKAHLKEEEQKYARFLYTLLTGVFLIVCLGVFFWSKSQGKKRRLKEIIKYLEVSRDNFIKIKPSQKVNTKRIAIPEETERSLLQKLKRFENSQKFLNKDMSLAVLAGQFETNTKYLSGIINKHYNDNFNTFINKLRINYIINKLKNEPHYINYKISFLAEESGYSSHSNFATVFKSIVGMSPARFINLIREEREELMEVSADK